MLCLLLAALHSITPIHAAADLSQLTLDSIFTAEEFKDEKLETLHWSKQGAYYFSLESTGKAIDLAPPSPMRPL